MVHVLIGLDGHQLVDPYGAGLAHPSEIVTLQVDQHDVLGPFLGVGRELAHFPTLAGRIPAAGTRPGNGTCVDPAAINPHQPLRR